MLADAFFIFLEDLKENVIGEESPGYLSRTGLGIQY